LSPQMVSIAAELAHEHFIALNSNLSTDIIKDFCAVVPNERVEYVHGAVHFQQRKKQDGLEALVRRVKFLRDGGYPIYLSCVMDSAAFLVFEKLFERFANIGIPLIPKALRGWYFGRPFPESYSKRERMKFQEWADNASTVVRESPWAPMRNDPTINPLIDRYFLEGFPDFTSVSCSAGSCFVRIKPNGTVFRCGKRTSIGDLRAGDVGLFGEPRPCADSCCPYICLRYADVGLERARYLPRRVGVEGTGG
jgi:hypothetical protein